MPVSYEGKKRREVVFPYLKKKLNNKKVMTRCGPIRLATSDGCVRKQRDT
jgi:hypothetical protein